MDVPSLYRWVSGVRGRAYEIPNHQKGYTMPIDDLVGQPARSHLSSMKDLVLLCALQCIVSIRRDSTDRHDSLWK